ncbi:flagellar biosynthesis protein FlgJ [Actomonas aquatica]|uniref:Flagellar biosynthesis protein FlgJ n=1 Tax=Actomonas aquatica TaxID=2866162 RepID=A0ABZ1C7X4_9BACT|nr:flagellar biosynthesis protein FlgJ [Opitutus sp. WL0086]WRQ87606.1 flagellar biosynthesis protein FlgJ [Opitutus sp. WL0086]
MNVSAVSSTLGVATRPDGPRDRNDAVSPQDIKKVAAQFEAIIVRQLLKPAIDPIMGGGGGMGGGQGGAVGGGGGGVYGYLLTDVLAGSLAQGGKLGFASLVEQQLTPDALKAAYAEAMQADANAAANSHVASNLSASS